MPALEWRAAERAFVASFGDEGQGHAVVYRWEGGWSWFVDALPGDAEPGIFGRRHDTIEDAQADAAAQVAAWPSLVEGARHV